MGGCDTICLLFLGELVVCAIAGTYYYLCTGAVFQSFIPCFDYPSSFASYLIHHVEGVLLFYLASKLQYSKVLTSSSSSYYDMLMRKFFVLAVDVKVWGFGHPSCLERKLPFGVSRERY